MGQATPDVYTTVGILDEINETIDAIKVKLQPVLLCDPRVNMSADEEVEKAKSQVRERLSSILTELNILNSRIEL